MKGIWRAVFAAVVATGAGMLSTTALAGPLPLGAVATVVKLYHDYAWEAVIDEPMDGTSNLFDQPASVLSRYFDRHMVDLIIRDRLCKERIRDICRLDLGFARPRRGGNEHPLHF
ncbi:MAG: hypothetical protein WA777_10790 [Rhodanobacter sp.]